MSSSTLSCVTFLLVISIVHIVRSADYDGYYDISAKDTGYLCSLMDTYKKTGVQPDIINNPATEFPKEKYIRSEDHKCWRNRWSPCEDSDLKKARPCGWYQMEEAPEEECP